MAALTLTPVDALSQPWQPDPGGLVEVTQLLHATTGVPSLSKIYPSVTSSKTSRKATSTSTATTKSQAELYKQFQEFSENPLFNNYLAYILANGGEYEINGSQVNITEHELPEGVPRETVLAVRQAAGLVLKNNLKNVWKLMSNNVKLFVVTSIMAAICDKSSVIQSVAASCLAIILQTTLRSDTDAIIGNLLKGLDGELNGTMGIRGALLTFSRIAEDKPQVLMPCLASIMKKVLLHVKSRDSEITSLALQIVNQYLLVLPKQYVADVDGFLRVVFSAANNANPQVRAKVCAAVVILMKAHPHALDSFLDDVIAFMLKACHDDADLVQYEAIEFWPVFAALPHARHKLAPYMERVLTTLADGVVYSEEERVELEVEDEEAEEELEKEQDLHPRQFFAGEAAHAGRAKMANLADEGKGSSAASDEEEDESEEVFDDAQLQWSVRRASARALEKLASLYQCDILQLLLPLLRDRISSNKWYISESAILILGAVANDCYSGMLPHLPELIRFLASRLQDSRAPVRCISCWTLGRYSRFSIRHDILSAHVIQDITSCALDENRNVQKAALSALCDHVEEGRRQTLSAHLSTFVDMIRMAFRQYRKRNFSLLCDFVSTIASNANGLLGTGKYVEPLLTILLAKREQLANSERSLIPLLGCISDVVRASHFACHDFAPGIVKGCLQLIAASEVGNENGTVANAYDEEQADELAACAFDQISAVTEALGLATEELVNQDLLETTYQGMGDMRPDVRLGAIALAGELARINVPLVRAALKSYTARCVSSLDPERTRVANNAAWTLGEMILYSEKCGSDGRKDVGKAVMGAGVDHLVQILTSYKGSKALLQNTAVCVGKMAWVFPELLVERLTNIAQRWLEILRGMKHGSEKEKAFRGFCRLAKAKPGAIVDNFVSFCDLICSWWGMDQELGLEVKSIFEGLKRALGMNWGKLLQSLPQMLLKCLYEHLDERLFRMN